MAQKKSVSKQISKKTSLMKNPLAQVFGSLLQDKRARINKTSAELAAEIGLSDSHYRMIEAGTATLQSNRVVELMRWVENWEFSRVCEILVCIQILDGYKNSVSDMRQAVDILAEEENPDLKMFFNDFNALWPVLENESSKEVAKKVKELNISGKLEEYLSGASIKKNTAVDLSRAYLTMQKVITGVAPYYYDLLRNLANGLKESTPRITSKELDMWESKYYKSIKRVYGLCRYKEAVLESGSCFGYKYLWKNSFEKFSLMAFDADDGAQFKIQFKNSLKNSLQESILKNDSLIQSIDKIFDGKVEALSCKKYHKQADKLLQYSNVPMNNLWIYELNLGYCVCFMDNYDPSHHDRDQDAFGVSLGWNETIDKFEKIEQLCESCIEH